MEKAQRLINHDYGLIKVASGGASALFFSFFLPLSPTLTFSLPSCSSQVLTLASVHHGHYLILLMALQGKEVPMTTSDLALCPYHLSFDENHPPVYYKFLQEGFIKLMIQFSLWNL